MGSLRVGQDWGTSLSLSLSVSYLSLKLNPCSFSDYLCWIDSLPLTLFLNSDFLFSTLFFSFYFIFKLYNIVLVLPYINMNPPQVYTCSPCWTLIPPPSPYHPSGSSQCTSPKHPVPCIKPGLATRFIYETWKQSRCPSADEWIRKLWYIFSTLNGIVLFTFPAATWNRIYLRKNSSCEAQHWFFLLIFLLIQHGAETPEGDPQCYPLVWGPCLM